MSDWNGIANHWQDADGNPGGGSSQGMGFVISWQRGPLGRHAAGCDSSGCVDGCTRLMQNGAFVEDVLEAVKDRLHFYQNGKFANIYNEKAISKIKEALKILRERTSDREKRQVEGTLSI